MRIDRQLATARNTVRSRGKVLRWSFAACVAGAILMAIWQYRPSAVVEDLRGEVATAPDEAALVALRQLAELGEPGIAAVAEAVGSPRPAVAAGARTVLLETIDGWAFLPAEEAHPRLEHLLAVLSDLGSALPPSGRELAVEIAMKSLRWDFPAADLDSSQLLASCETILRNHQSTRYGSADEVSEQSLAEGELTSAEEPEPRRSLQYGHSPSSADVALPGGALPIHLPLSSSARQSAPTIDGSQDATPAAEGRPVSFLRQPLRFPAEQPAKPLPTGSTAVGEAGLDGASHAEQHQQLVDSPTIDLIRQLRSGDGSRVDQVRAELSRRGFGPVELELAERITNPDPEVRKMAADVLPRLRIDAKPWLIWLSRDEDADVRLAAVGLMATSSSEPEMRSRLEELALSDPDRRVQQIAERVTRSAVRPEVR